MMNNKKLIIIGIVVVLLLAAVFILTRGPGSEPPITQKCEEIKADLEYHCPYRSVNENDDIIISTFDSLHSVKADGSNQKNLIVNVPDGWVLMMNSISPNHERLLLTMWSEPHLAYNKLSNFCCRSI